MVPLGSDEACLRPANDSVLKKSLDLEMWVSAA